MSLEYSGFMTGMVDYYNNISNPHEKNQILFILLAKMYSNKFNKNANCGVLLQTITKCGNGDPLSAAFKLFSKEKLVFDENENALKISDIFSVKATEMALDGKYGTFIRVELTEQSMQNHERFLLGENENCLVIDHNFKRKGRFAQFNLTQKPCQTESLEIRTYDFAGIEVERQIIDTVNLGVDGYNETNKEEYIYPLITGLHKCMKIKNKTKMSRDPDCFLMVKIESEQEITSCLEGEYSMALEFKDIGQHASPINISHTNYAQCVSGYQLGARTSRESYEESLEECLYWLDFYAGDQTPEQTLTISPRVTFLPEMNTEIRKRVERAKVYCQNYLDERRK